MAYVPYVAPTDTIATGNITTQNLVPAGTATAGSAVEVSCANKGGATIQVTGTYTGILSIQGTVNGTVWVTLAIASKLKNINTDAYSATIASAAQSIYALDCAGYVKIRVSGLAAMTGTATVTINCSAVQNSVMIESALPAGTAVMGHVIIDSGSTTAVTGSLTSAGTTTATLAANQIITPVPQAGQGASTTHHLISAASTNATSVKGSAGVINMIVVSNINAAIRYFKLYNKATAPTVGTDTPILTQAMPGGGAPCVIHCGPFGLRCSTGIAYALTTGITVADTGAVSVSETAVHINYT